MGGNAWYARPAHSTTILVISGCPPHILKKKKSYLYHRSTRSLNSGEKTLDGTVGGGWKKKIQGFRKITFFLISQIKLLHKYKHIFFTKKL